VRDLVDAHRERLDVLALLDDQDVVRERDEPARSPSTPSPRP
jgi:hypothetical protein